jgi:thiamine-monophosphate kinase
VATELSADAINWVLAGGDDHAFALTAKELPQGAIRIGEVTAGAGVLLNGEPIELLGYRHFSE